MTYFRSEGRKGMTPRTDAQKKWDDSEGGIYEQDDGWLIATDFARSLEHELQNQVLRIRKSAQAWRDHAAKIDECARSVIGRRHNMRRATLLRKCAQEIEAILNEEH